MGAVKAIDPEGLNFSDDKLSFLKQHYAKDATDMEFDHFIGVCRSRGLNPEAKHIYFLKFKNKKTGVSNVSHVLSIGAYRLIAQRAGVYAGSSEPIFNIGSDGKPVSCTVTVSKIVKNQICEFTGKAFLSEQMAIASSDAMWNKMPFAMLEKCAEAKALRKAFPEDLSGLYLKEEMPSEPITLTENTPELAEASFDKEDFGRVKALNKLLAEKAVPQDKWAEIAEQLDGVKDSNLKSRLGEILNGLSQ